MATVERLKDSEIILIKLGRLSGEYESFVTSITTRFDYSMMFPSLCELLMDHDMMVPKGCFPNPGVINAVSKTDPKISAADPKIKA